MPLLNFAVKKCIPMVENGKPYWKRQTIRKLRKRPFKVGDILYLYTGLRTKNCRKIGEAFCTEIEEIKLCLSSSIPWAYEKRFTVDRDYWKLLTTPELDQLAIDDGFNSLMEMWKWFQKTHGEKDQIFQVIKWRDLLKPEVIHQYVRKVQKQEDDKNE